MLLNVYPNLNILSLAVDAATHAIDRVGGVMRNAPGYALYRDTSLSQLKLRTVNAAVPVLVNLALAASDVWALKD